VCACGHVCLRACLRVYIHTHTHTHTHFFVTFLQLPIPDPTQNTGTCPAIRLLKRLVSFAAQLVSVIQIIVPSVFQITRISFNPLFWVFFLMLKQICAVMLTRQQPCPAVRVGTSGCDNTTFCLLKHNGYTEYWVSHKRHRSWGVSLYVQKCTVCICGATDQDLRFSGLPNLVWRHLVELLGGGTGQCQVYRRVTQT
jgi:hypothetical protein